MLLFVVIPKKMCYERILFTLILISSITVMVIPVLLSPVETDVHTLGKSHQLWQKVKLLSSPLLLLYAFFPSLYK